MGISQSAISRCTAELEDRVGVPLFDRHTWGVSQTRSGQYFLSRVIRAIEAIDEGARDAAALVRPEYGRLRIGLYSSIASGFLAKLLETCLASHGTVRMDLVNGSANEHIAALRDMKIDIAFLAGDLDLAGCRRLPLWTERVFIALSASHPLALQQRLTWDELAHASFVIGETAPGQEIHDYILHKLADHAQAPDVVVQRVGWNNLLPLMALGQQLTIVSEAMTAMSFPGIVYRPIVGERLEFAAVWLPANDNPTLRRFLSLAKAMAVKPENRKPSQPFWPSQTHDPSQ